ncbi:unnamed protein product [Prunus brigantina]
MLDTIATKRRAYLLIDKQGAIIGYNLIRDSKSAYDIFTDEICDGSPCGLSKRNRLHPLCEILSGCEDPYSRPVYEVPFHFLFELACMLGIGWQDFVDEGCQVWSPPILRKRDGE